MSKTRTKRRRGATEMKEVDSDREHDVASFSCEGLGLEVDEHIVRGLGFAILSTKGKKGHQEDNFQFRRAVIGEKVFWFFGVFDGHLCQDGIVGDRCSAFCKVFQFDLIIRHEKFLTDPIKAVRDSFTRVDELWHQVSFSDSAQGLADGTTATVAVLNLADKKITIGQVGDSRCLIVRDQGNVEQGFQDHNCSNRNERERLKDHIKKDETGEERVMDRLAVTRTIGDYIDGLREIVICEPEVKTLSLDDAKFFFVASDGVADAKITIDAVRNVLQENSDSLERATTELRNRSLSSNDNITMIVAEVAKLA